MMRNFCEDEKLKLLARFDFLDVCLLGETGTGKSHTARIIHRLSPRAENSFTEVNCAELAPSLIEAELFGHEKGAFTGAYGSKEGRFEAAAGGTLFLDEIGELPPNLQPKLLKVIEEKCVIRVGGRRPRPFDVRIIYATNQNLGVLRADMRYRVTAHTFHLKPLRQRRDEIVPFARLFISEFNRKSGQSIRATDAALKILETPEWRGNVRELRSFIENACLSALSLFENGISSDCPIELTDELLQAEIERFSNNSPVREIFPSSENLPEQGRGEKLEDYLKRVETILLKNALQIHNNNQTRAARELGISRSGLIKKMKKIGH
jgi:transcriptional regulator with PAS, ATPase and Fis domain